MSAESAGLSLTQRLQSLWSDDRQGVYAVLLGSRVPGLGARLEDADIDDWGLLWSGALDPAEREAAPCLVRLRRDSEFTQWLLSEAATSHGDWGLLLCSRRSFVEMRTHGRALCEASLADGSELRLDWADPAVLQALLPLAPPQQLAWLFTGVESIVIATARQWSRLSLALGRLQVQRSDLLAAA